MKKVPCGNPDCGSRRIHWEDQDTPRGQQMIEVKDDFNEKAKAFCSFTCLFESGYSAISVDRCKENGGICVDGNWWLKDPSCGTDPRFKELWEKENR
jgi:hypothetical protein